MEIHYHSKSDLSALIIIPLILVLSSIDILLAKKYIRKIMLCQKCLNPLIFLNDCNYTVQSIEDFSLTSKFEKGKLYDMKFYSN